MTRSPLIDGRDRAQILAALSDRRVGFVPEWSPRAQGPGRALASIVARYLELQAEALNRVPDRSRFAFLDMLGNSLLAAQPARTPLVFTLMETAPLDVTLPERTRVAAQLPPSTPSLAGGKVARASEAPQYFTEQTIRLTRAAIVAIYTVDPQSDTYAEHTPALNRGFKLFDDMHPTPHVLYLGHDELFRLSGVSEIVLAFDSYPAHENKPYRPLLLDWEYCSEDGWLPLELYEDRTLRMTADGTMTLIKRCGPDAKEETIAGRKSYWIRATVSARIPSARIAMRPSGYWLQLNAVTGAELDGYVTIDGSLSARILAIEDKTLILDRELTGALNAAVVKQAPGGAIIGAVTRVYSGFRVPVEDPRELLPHDVVTTDGQTIGTVMDIDGPVIVVDHALPNALTGNTIGLIDALPPLSPEGTSAGLLPTLDVIRARVGFTKADLAPDSAYVDTAPLDTSNHFYPFGRQPVRYTTFYINSKETFQRRTARVVISIGFAQVGRADFSPKLTPEYFDGTRWTEITSYYEHVDSTANFTKPALPATGTLSFVCPSDWQETEVNGEKGYFLRLRLDAGNYGSPLEVKLVSDGAGGYKVETAPATLQPPIIATLRLAYTFYTKPDLVDHCVTYNDFAYVDRTDDARWPRRPFQPFVPVGDTFPALHFAFKQRMPAGLISLFVHVPSDAESGGYDAQPLPFIWEYRSEQGWSELSVLDETNGFRTSGMVQFVGPADMALSDGMGGALARIRARLKPGLRVEGHRLSIGGMWLNAVWASQGESIERETLGISNGDARQTLVLPPLHVPVLPGELVEVREWSGRGDDWETAVEGVPAADLRFEVDPRDGRTKTAVWVRWHAQPHLYASKTDDRHYVIERTSGTYRFGGDGFGMIPPAGARIVASFATGGGLRGNVAAGTITELRSGVGYVESVINPLPATGGVETEIALSGRDRSTQRLRHRSRAVSASDYEWLAYESTPEVARARALPLLGPSGHGERGFVSLVVVPHSVAATPTPTLELSRRVIAHLRANAPAGLGEQIQIVAPSYVRISVRAEIVPLVPEDAALVESRVREALERYLHPLTGGDAGSGWNFGDAVYLSSIAVLVESTAGVDYVSFLQLKVGDVLHADWVAVEPGSLVASGDHQLKLKVGARSAGSAGAPAVGAKSHAVA